MWLLILIAILILVGIMSADSFKASPKIAAYVVEKWRPLVQKYYAFYPNVPVTTALAMIAYESKGDPEAVNPERDKTAEYDDSVGLFQITDRRLIDFNRATGKDYNFSMLKTPWVNVEVGMWGLSDHMKHFNDLDKTVRAHNGGRGGINLAQTAIYLGRVKQYEALITSILG